MTAEQKGLALFDAWLDASGDDEAYWVAAVAEALRAAERVAYDRAKKAALDRACCPAPHRCGHCVVARDIASDIAALAEEVANGRDV